MSDTILKKVGDGYLPGVPARDLTQNDWDNLAPTDQQAALACGLYEAVGGKKKADALATQAEQAAAAVAPIEEVGG